MPACHAGFGRRTQTDGGLADTSCFREVNIVQLGEHFERKRRQEEHDTASRKLQSC
jgi:hypothetical protein